MAVRGGGSGKEKSFMGLPDQLEGGWGHWGRSSGIAAGQSIDCEGWDNGDISPDAQSRRNGCQKNLLRGKKVIPGGINNWEHRGVSAHSEV